MTTNNKLKFKDKIDLIGLIVIVAFFLSIDCILVWYDYNLFIGNTDYHIIVVMAIVSAFFIIGTIIFLIPLYDKLIDIYGD